MDTLCKYLCMFIVQLIVQCVVKQKKRICLPFTSINSMRNVIGTICHLKHLTKKL